MTYELTKLIEDNLKELNKIVIVKEEIQAQLVGALENLAQTRTDYGTNQEYRQANQKVKELELQLDLINSRGQRYIFKIDQLNGVR
jgi:uncharacterized protein Yka (UPF0111/DUF47 family)